MNIDSVAYRVLQKLKDGSLDDKKTRELAIMDLEYSLEHCKDTAN